MSFPLRSALGPHAVAKTGAFLISTLCKKGAAVVQRDKNGREILAGDIIRVPHYIDRRTRRRVYMYKLVVEKHTRLYAVDILELARKRLEDAHCCRLDLMDHASQIKIMDGRDRTTESGQLQTWYERPRLRPN